MTDSNTRIEQLNAMAPDFIKLLGGSIIELDLDDADAAAFESNTGLQVTYVGLLAGIRDIDSKLETPTMHLFCQESHCVCTTRA